MIDFHTHIIPNIDDGSRNIDETFNLIQEAKNAGFEGIVLTSHYMENYYETGVKERDIWVKVIKDNIMDLLIEGKASTINNTSYVLFEMPLNAEPMNLYNVIYSLQENKLIPILAHPERYSFIQKEPEFVYELIEKGVLMQANYGSILGQYGEKAKIIVKKLLSGNMIHFLGTDVHREKTIYKLIPQAIEEIENIIGSDKLEKLTTKNPKLALENKKIEIDDPIEMKLSIKEKIIMYLKKY